MSQFDPAIEYVITQDEGGFVNNQADPGGATNMGITQKVLSDWRGQNCTEDDVKELTRDEAKRIYEANYWKPLQLDSIKDQGIATALLDVGVNRGVAGCICLAQTAVGEPRLVSQWPRTVSAINTMGKGQFIPRFVCELQNHYVTLALSAPSFLQFLKGWINRSQRILMLMV